MGCEHAPVAFALVAHDGVLLPLLRSKEPTIADVSERVEDQHVRIDTAIDHLRSSAADGRIDAPGITAFSDLLEDHLALEEQQLLPIWVASLSPADHERLGRRLRRSTPWRDIAVVVPWLLDAVPDAFSDEAKRELPAPVRFAYRLGLRRQFERTWNRPGALPVRPRDWPSSPRPVSVEVGGIG